MGAHAGTLHGNRILATLERRRKIAYTTVVTTLARLHQKGALKRERVRPGALALVHPVVEAAAMFVAG